MVGALLGLVGDIALLGDGDAAFAAGLSAFAFGHVGYVVAALGVGFALGWAVCGAVFVAALLGFRFVGRTLPGARRLGGTAIAVAVGVYACVISVMVVTAWGSGVLPAAVGAALVRRQRLADRLRAVRREGAARADRGDDVVSRRSGAADHRPRHRLIKTATRARGCPRRSM